MQTPIPPFTILYINVLVFLVIIWHKGITSSLSRMLLSSSEDSFEEDTQLLPTPGPSLSHYWTQYTEPSSHLVPPGKVNALSENTSSSAAPGKGMFTVQF